MGFLVSVVGIGLAVQAWRTRGLWRGVLRGLDRWPLAVFAWALVAMPLSLVGAVDQMVGLLAWALCMFVGVSLARSTEGVHR